MMRFFSFSFLFFFFVHLIDAQTNFDYEGLHFQTNAAGNAATLLKSDDYANLTEVVIPDSVTFSGVRLPVTQMDESCFENCTQLEKVTIGSCISIPANTTNYFTGCTALKHAIVRYNSTGGHCYQCPFSAEIMNQIETLEFANTIKLIHSDYWWKYGTNIKTLHLPSSLSFEGSVNGIAYADRMYNMKKLENLIVDEGGIYFVKDTVLYFTKNNETHLIFYPHKKSITTFTLPEDVSVVGTGAFRGHTALQSVNLSNTQKLYQYAFCECTALKEVTFPSSLIFLSNEVFNGASALTSIDMSPCTNLTSIPKQTFCNCTRLASIILPPNLTNLGQDVFKNTAWKTNFSNWEGDFLYLGHVLVATKYENLNAQVQVKDGTRVLGYGAFLSCTNIQSITLPSSVQYINATALSGCSNLSEINLSNIREIGQGAFYSCNQLSEVDLSNIVTISSQAFQICQNLGEITLGRSLRSLGASAFYNCPAISHITCYSPVPITLTADPFYNVGDKSQIHLSVLKGTEALYAAKNYWKDFDIHGDREAAPGARYTVDGLVYKILTSSPEDEGNTVAVTWDNADVLINSTKRTYSSLSGEVVIPSTVNIHFSLGDDVYTVTEIDDKAFYQCENITSITIPHTVTKIGRDAFRHCDKLATVTINDNSQMTEIGSCAFYNNSQLTTLANVPSTIQTINDSAFAFCTNLATFAMPTAALKKVGHLAFNKCSNLPDFVLSDGIEYIGYRAFYWCDNYITRAYVPASVTYLGDEAWGNTTKIKHWEVESNNTNYCVDEQGILYNKDKTHLMNCFASNPITEYDIPSSVTQMSDLAFWHVQTLQRISFPENLKTIPHAAFYECSNLKKLDLRNVEIVGEAAFQSCSAVDTILLGSDCKELQLSCFSGIISNVNAGTSRPAFFFMCEATTPPTARDNTITDLGKNAPADFRTVIVPMSSKKTYMYYSQWHNNTALKGYTYFFIQSNEPQYGTTIGSGFKIEGETVTPTATPARNCQFVKWGDNQSNNPHTPVTVNIGNDNYTLTAYFEPIPLNVRDTFRLTNPEGIDILYTVLTKDNETMTVAVGLTDYTDITAIDTTTEGELIIPATIDYFGDEYDVVMIGVNAFKQCRRLTKVTVPASVKIIENEAFGECISLTQVELNEGLEKLTYGAFQKCSSITSITLPSSLTRLGSYTFYECRKLETVNIPEQVTYIEEWTFGYCKKLTTITLHENIKWIGYAAFNSSGLTTLNWTTSSIERVGLAVFSNTPWFETLNATNGAKYADDILMYQADAGSLTEFTVKDNTRVIAGGSMGWYLDDLVSISIPASVQYIGQDAFYDNTALNKCTLYATTPPLIYHEQWVERTNVTANEIFRMWDNSSSTYYDKENMVVYVPKEALETYKANEQWQMMELRPIGGWDVTFIDGNGSLIGNTQHIEHRSIPTVPDSINVPVRDTTTEWIYVFNGQWLLSTNDTVREGQTTFSDMTYQALYDSTPHPYTITFVDENESFLWDTIIGYGNTIHYNGQNPSKEPTTEHIYSFAGWDGDYVENVTTVVGNKTYKALYNENMRPYPIHFVNTDTTHTLLWDTILPYDTPINYGGPVPYKDSTAQYNYTFKGWSDNFENGVTIVSGEHTYTALYDSLIRTYTITFINTDTAHTLLWDTILPYDTPINYGGPVPYKDSTAQYNYTFIGWSDNFEDGVTIVSGEHTYTALYDSTLRHYSVAFVDGLTNDTILLIDTTYGASIVPPSIPEHDGYTPNGWDSDTYQNVQSDILIIVTYTPSTSISYTTNEKLLKTKKIIEKGHIIILKDAKRYNVVGLEVDK